MHDQNRRERPSSTGRKVKVTAAGIGDITAGVSNVNIRTYTILAVTKNAVVDIVKRRQGNLFNNRSRKDRQHQKGKGDKQENSKRRRGFEQHGDALQKKNNTEEKE